MLPAHSLCQPAQTLASLTPSRPSRLPILWLLMSDWSRAAWCTPAWPLQPPAPLRSHTAGRPRQGGPAAAARPLSLPPPHTDTHHAMGHSPCHPLGHCLPADQPQRSSRVLSCRPPCAGPRSWASTVPRGPPLRAQRPTHRDLWRLPFPVCRRRPRLPGHGHVVQPAAGRHTACPGPPGCRLSPLLFCF